MTDYVVYDEDGSWVVNERMFPFVDTQGRRFEVGTKVKVSLAEGSWAKGQVDAGVLTPTSPPELPPADPAPAPAPKAAAKPAPAPPPAP
jgi:hypothetical protein